MGHYKRGVLVTTKSLSEATGLTEGVVRRHVNKGRVKMGELNSVVDYVSRVRLWGYDKKEVS